VIQFEPEIDRSLFHETLQFAKRQVRAVTEKYPGFYPMYTLAGKWKHEGRRGRTGATVSARTDVDFPKNRARGERGQGLLDAEGDRVQSAAGAAAVRPRSARPGFIFLSTYYRWYQVTREPRLNDVLVQAGKTMALRFGRRASTCARSWERNRCSSTS